jgi:hypothetical protein
MQQRRLLRGEQPDYEKHSLWTELGFKREQRVFSKVILAILGSGGGVIEVVTEVNIYVQIGKA